MRKIVRSFIFLTIANIFSIAAFAQGKTINGNVTNLVSGESVPAVSVTVKGEAT